MGYQEMLFKAENMDFQKFKELVVQRKVELENPPFDWCKVQSVITFKKEMEGSYYGLSKHTLEAGASYIWVNGQRSATFWMVNFFKHHLGLKVESMVGEFIPNYALIGFREYLNKFNNCPELRGRFENEFVIVEPLEMAVLSQ